MSFLQKLRNPESTVALFFWTVLWTPFQAVFLSPFSLMSLVRLVNAQHLPFPNLFSFYPQVFVGYLFAPIVYCTLISMLFKPKRLVSPLNVEIGAFVLVGAEFFVSTYSSPFTLITVLASLIILGIILGIALLVGIFQQIIVRVLIGLDYDEKDIQQLTYSCNANFETLLKALTTTSFFKTWKFEPLRNEKELKIYRWSLKTTLTKSTNMILAIAPDNRNEEGAVLSFVAYRKTFNYEIGSAEDKLLIQDFCKILRQDLFDINVIYDLTEDKTANLSVSELAKLYAKQPARSMFGIAKEPIIGVWHISHYYASIIAVTVAIIAGLTLAFIFRWGTVDPNTYLNIIILAILVLLAEIGIPLREVLDRREEKKLK